MKTDKTGGPSAADTNVEERLSRRFAVELERAERDYPALMRPRRAPVRSTPVWRRIAVPMTVVVALVAVSLVGMGIALRPSAGPTLPNNPAPVGIVKGSDGIPTSIDGQRVYRIGDQSEWQNLSGSFLLSGYAVQLLTGCKGQFGSPPPEDAFISSCDAMLLTPGPVTDFNGFDPSTFPSVAPLSMEALRGWFGGPAIVMRVHTHDPGAAKCAAYLQPRCESAVVVEAVVWPTVPTQINGERVYRAADQASFPTAGSFLLGGHVTKPSVMPPCPAPIDKTAAEQQLFSYCNAFSIDGLYVAPMSNLDEPNNEIVVAKVHLHDPLAAQCPAVSSAVCEAAIVVESVIWRSGEGAVAASPSSGGSSTTPSNPASGEGVGPVSSASIGSGPSAGSAQGSGGIGFEVGPLDSDGVPRSITRLPVYRASNLPADSTFLLGGPLTHDTGCAPTTAAAPPSCGYWTVDGVKVGTQVALPDSPTGGLVVARIQRSKLQVDCANPPCAPIETLVVTEIVWSGPAVVAPPPPVLPVPPAS
jgi:hypothetical protein